MPEDPSAQSPTMSERPTPTPAPRPIIMPTVGRVVLYYPGENILGPDNRPIRTTKQQPYPAIITHVWGSDCVNIAPLPDGSFGTIGPRTSVIFRQPNTTAPHGDYVEWMPYQVDQVQKTEKVEGGLAAKVEALHAAVRHTQVGQTDRTCHKILDAAFGDPLSPQSA